MSKALRIVFMGTPDFAVTTLQALVNNNYKVVGVITAPDRPAGRGRKVSSSAVKKYAEAENLNILQPTNLKDEGFIKTLSDLNANLQIVVAFRMLPKAVWNMPSIGTFNLHASLLPNYRGAAPINWAIINGEKKTGVTTFFIDEKIDTGVVILQNSITIDKEDTAGTLHDKLMNIGAALVLQTVQLIEEEKATTIAQEETDVLKSAYKIHKDTCKINWTLSGETIYNFIRGLSPYPAAWTQLMNENTTLNIKIYKATFSSEDHDHKIGLLISDKKTAKIAIKDGYMELHEFQLPGKKPMPVKDILNGFSFKNDAYVY